MYESDSQGVKVETFIQTNTRAETGSWGRQDRSKVAAGGLGWARRWLADLAVPPLPADKPGGTTGERDRPRNPVFQHVEIILKT